MSENPRQFTHDDYTVGIIYALADTEWVAVCNILDKEHLKLPAAEKDLNQYCLDKMDNHYIVIACLPAHMQGTKPAAIVARDILRSFKAIRFGLMVGIGGGVPLENPTENEAFHKEDSENEYNNNLSNIRLGDIVVSLQSKAFPAAIIKYNIGKSVQGGEFFRTDQLHNPPTILLGIIAMAKMQHKRKSHKLPDYISKIFIDYPHLIKKFKYPGSHQDRAFKSTITHKKENKLYKACCGPFDSNIIRQKTRETTSPVIYYRIIRSANQIMKDSILRDKWAKKEGILYFEIEAADLYFKNYFSLLYFFFLFSILQIANIVIIDLIDTFPYLVIRGICDYADSHKNKIWQPYAVVTAAAYAKDLLSHISAEEMREKKSILEVSG